MLKFKDLIFNFILYKYSLFSKLINYINYIINKKDFLN